MNEMKISEGTEKPENKKYLFLMKKKGDNYSHLSLYDLFATIVCGSLENEIISVCTISKANQ